LFEVERVRDGKSFATRSVKALQANKCIFIMTVSFHVDEPGPSHQIPLNELRAYLPAGQLSRNAGRVGWQSGTDTPTPSQLLRAGRKPFEHNSSKWVDILHVAEGDRWLLRWFKYNQPAGSPPLSRAQGSAVLAYLSDMQMVTTVRQPHGQEGVFSMSISLDHSIYFHRKYDPSQWLLCFCETSTSAGARGIAKTEMYQLQGRGGSDSRVVHVATVYQEALVRVPKTWTSNEEGTGDGGASKL
jgi:acyl-CoA thioesterase-2